VQPGQNPSASCTTLSHSRQKWCPHFGHAYRPKGDRSEEEFVVVVAGGLAVVVVEEEKGNVQLKQDRGAEEGPILFSHTISRIWNQSRGNRCSAKVWRGPGYGSDGEKKRGEGGGGGGGGGSLTR
jgi:hypothetical protein